MHETRQRTTWKPAAVSPSVSANADTSARISAICCVVTRYAANVKGRNVFWRQLQWRAKYRFCFKLHAVQGLHDLLLGHVCDHLTTFWLSSCWRGSRREGIDVIRWEDVEHSSGKLSSVKIIRKLRCRIKRNIARSPVRRRQSRELDVSDSTPFIATARLVCHAWFSTITINGEGTPLPLLWRLSLHRHICTTAVDLSSSDAA